MLHILNQDIAVIVKSRCVQENIKPCILKLMPDSLNMFHLSLIIFHYIFLIFICIYEGTTEDKRFVCDLCGRSLMNNHELQHHISLHGQ